MEKTRNCVNCQGLIPEHKTFWQRFCSEVCRKAWWRDVTKRGRELAKEQKRQNEKAEPKP